MRARMLATPMYIPTAFVSGGGVVIESTFVDVAADVCLTRANASTSGEVSGRTLLCDVVQADSAFLPSLGSHLGSGGSTAMHHKAYQNSFHSILIANAQIAHARANAILNSIFFNLMSGAASATLKAVGCFRTVKKS